MIAFENYENIAGDSNFEHEVKEVPVTKTVLHPVVEEDLIENDETDTP